MSDELNKEENIENLLLYWKQIHELKKELVEREEVIKNKVKVFLKERNWTDYKDDKNKIHVVITKTQRKVFDEKQMKMMLTPSQLAQVVRLTTFERMSITTPEMRERLKKYVKTKTNFN